MAIRRTYHVHKSMLNVGRGSPLRALLIAMIRRKPTDSERSLGPMSQ